MGNEQAAAGVGPLSGEHVAQLLESRERTKSVRKAIRYAGLNGLTAALIAAAVAPFAIMNGDTPGMVLAGVMAVLGYRELQLRKGLRRMLPTAASGLATNQVFLGLAVIGYAVWRLVAGPGASSVSEALASDPTLSEMFETLNEYAHVGIYVGVIVATVVVQGFALFFYSSKRGLLERFSSECPPWVVDLYRRGVMG